MQEGRPRTARVEKASLRCSTAGAATRRGEIAAEADADEDAADVCSDEGEHGEERQHLIDGLATGALLLRQEDEESRAPRGCTRAAREVRILKGAGDGERGKRKNERKQCGFPLKTRRRQNLGETGKNPLSLPYLLGPPSRQARAPTRAVLLYSFWQLSRRRSLEEEKKARRKERATATIDAGRNSTSTASTSPPRRLGPHGRPRPRLPLVPARVHAGPLPLVAARADPLWGRSFLSVVVVVVEQRQLVLPSPAGALRGRGHDRSGLVGGAAEAEEAEGATAAAAAARAE
jgi:hypothetical protein